MLRIKLSRVGKKKQPIYRILVMERSKDPWGNYLENVGTYNPRTQPNTLEMKEDRVKHWLSMGAQPTDTVHNLLVEAGIIKEKKRNVSALGSKVKAAIKDEAAKAKEAVAAAAKEAKEKAEAEKAAAEAPKEEAKTEEAPAEEKKEA